MTKYGKFCNTQHRSVITELNLDQLTTRKKIKKTPTSGGWEVKLNRIANKDFWQEYTMETAKRNLESITKEISKNTIVEESWTLAKNTLLELDQMAKNLYKEKYEKKNSLIQKKRKA